MRPPLPKGRFLVLGLARAGQAAVGALRDAIGPESVRAWDGDTGAAMQRLRRQLESSGVQTQLGPCPDAQTLRWASVAVKSPGIPFAAPAVLQAQKYGCEVLDELEIGWRLSRAPMLAVTGTNGKSTVCGLTVAALSAAGHAVRLAGNAQFGDPLTEVSAAPLDWIVCEVSSFQLEGCAAMLPELSVLTNLTAAHLDRHGTLGGYGELKRRMFINGDEVVARAVIDVDGRFGRELAGVLAGRGASVARVGFAADADYRVTSAKWDLRRAQTTLSTPHGPITLISTLPGEHNARNLAAALAIADLTGVPRHIAATTLRHFCGVPGRFEHIDGGQPFAVIVDLANTPDALKQLLTAIRTAMKPGGRLIVVFGRGGQPTPTFPEMGRVMGELSDRLILTTSGFRGAPALPALARQLSGARTALDGSPEIVLDRRQAIRRAVLSARSEDVVVIPGRGAWDEMRPDPRGRPIPFDDRKVTLEIIRESLDAAIAKPAPRRSGSPRRGSPVADRDALTVQDTAQT
jgi:UDP-N-acetylmuramoyl-L-alanyl-D-glutamate--2,6-diaminopimelate ligase